MRENRTYGSEGGEGRTLPDPYLSYVFCQAPRHTTSSLRPMKVGEVSMR